jgi:glucokinase
MKVTGAGHYIGIDIGGTKTAVSIADTENDECNIIGSSFIETYRQPDFSVTADRIFEAIDTLLKEHRIPPREFAIGISCPGPLDTADGKIIFVPTTGWKDVPIVGIFAERYKVPVFLENDCACAALAEAHKGAGQGVNVVFYITVSTGVGSGICVNGDIFTGENGNAGEFGHICVEHQGLYCQCGGRGCLEMYSSGTSIAEHCKELAKEKSSLLSGKENINAYDVEMAVRQGDPVAAQVWNDAMEKLGIGVSIVYQLFNPGVIIFGGGVSNAWDLMETRLYSTVKQHVHEIIYPVIVERHILRQAKLGKYIGVTGAILLAHKKIEKEKI